MSKTFNFGDMFESSRSIVGQTLIDIGKIDKNAVVLTADLSRTNQTIGFKEAYSDRFFNVGIAEQNLFGIAAGLALEGKTPYILTFATFATLRACEQLRTDICYPNLKVRVIACNAGLTTGGGATHYGQEDISIARSMANLTVVSPSDPNMFRNVLMSTIDYDGPLYIRMAQGKGESLVYKDTQEYIMGKAIVCNEGNEITLISCGVTLSYVIDAAKILNKKGISVRVLDMHTVKPIDREAIIKSMQETRHIITIEDHYQVGGLGTAVAEVIAESGLTCKFKRLGIPQEYAGFGSADELYHKYGYDTDGVVDAVYQMLGDK